MTSFQENVITSSYNQFFLGNNYGLLRDLAPSYFNLTFSVDILSNY